MRYPLINSSFLDGFSELVLEKGGDPRAYYEAAGLNFETSSGNERLIPFDRQNNLLELAAIGLDFPDLSLQLARRQTIAIYGPLASMIIACPTIGDALKIFVEHIQLRVQTVKLNLILHQDTAEFSIASDFPKVADNIRFQDHGIALVYNLIKSLSGQHLSPRGVF